MNADADRCPTCNSPRHGTEAASNGGGAGSLYAWDGDSPCPVCEHGREEQAERARRRFRYWKLRRLNESVDTDDTTTLDDFAEGSA